MYHKPKLRAMYHKFKLRAMYQNPKLRAMYHNSQHFSISASTITHSCLECATLQHLLLPQPWWGLALHWRVVSCAQIFCVSHISWCIIASTRDHPLCRSNKLLSSLQMLPARWDTMGNATKLLSMLWQVNAMQCDEPVINAVAMQCNVTKLLSAVLLCVARGNNMGCSV